MAPSETRTGRLAGHPDGFGFASTEGGTVYVARADIGAAVHDDEVELQCWPAERGVQGRVTRIVARRERRLTGTLGESGTFVADDARFGRPLACESSLDRVGKTTLCGGVLRSAVGTAGAVELDVVKSFGKRGRARVEEDAILWREALDVPIPREALDEADGVARRAVDDGAREDLRALDFVTIDPATAEDHDDALYAEVQPKGGLRVWIAIADVSAFVDPDGALDREARRRGASIYLPGRVAPMLPPALSSGAASLMPDVDRPAVVLELSLDDQARVVERTLRFAMLRSKARMSYDEVGEILRADVAPRESARTTMLRAMSATAERLRAGRRSRGALAIDGVEIVIDTDAEGEPLAMRRVEHDFWACRAHQLVEEMMLLGNETVGSMLREAQIDAVFRAHADPKIERLERVIALADARGVAMGDEARRDPRALRTVLGAIVDPAVREELGAALLAALSSATYQDHREDHFALASREYVHFTSPIRRYADLTIHRALRALSSGQPLEGVVDTELLNETQRRSRAVHREIHDLHGALLMRGRIGQDLEGTMVHATKSEWIVSIDEPAIQVRCRRTRDVVDVGARVRVQLASVSIPARRVEAKLLKVLPAQN
ncbi:MAG: ribonuclease R [Myxococcota bacterium]|nr:ribonuclease R [Myxococcota bacterium]